MAYWDRLISVRYRMESRVGVETDLTWHVAGSSRAQKYPHTQFLFTASYCKCLPVCLRTSTGSDRKLMSLQAIPNQS